MWDKNIPLDQAYDYAEFTLSNGQTNYDVKANQSSLFHNVLLARNCIIWSTKNISARFNNTSFGAMTIDAGEAPLEIINRITIANLYLTNSSGSDSSIKIWLFH